MTAMPDAPEDISHVDRVGHVVVVGADSIVVRLTEELERAGEQTVIVARAGADPDLISDAEAHGAEVIHAGRVREPDLIAAGIRGAKAAVIIDEDDVWVIRVALVVEELNPDVRLVLGLSDARLGARLRPALGECEILSPAALAAPSFVAAALATTDTMTFEIGGRLVVAGPAERVGGDRLGVIGDTQQPELSGAVLPADGSGDIVLGTELIGRSSPAVRQSGMIGALTRVIDRRLRLVLLGLAILILLSTLYFRLVGVDWLEALYLAFTASTDTGIGDPDEPLGVGFRFGAVIIQLFGLVLSSGITAVIVDALISARLEELSGGIRGRPRDHVVVCGLGRIGTEVAMRLHSRGVSVVAIEQDDRAAGVSRIRARKIPVLIGAAGEDAILAAAGVSRAHAVLALTDNDSVNLEIGLVAKQAKEDVRVVTRVFDHELAGRVERRLKLGATRSLSMLAAPAFASAALSRTDRLIFPIGRWVLIFTELTVQPDSGAVGTRLSELPDPDVARVLAHRPTGGRRWDWQPGNPRLAVGDQLAVAATRTGLARMLLLTKITRPVDPASTTPDPT